MKPRRRPRHNLKINDQVGGVHPRGLGIAADASADMQSNRVGLGWISTHGHWGMRGHQYPYAGSGMTEIAELRAVAYAWDQITPDGPVTIMLDNSCAVTALNRWCGGDLTMPTGYRDAYRANGGPSALTVLAAAVAAHEHPVCARWIRGHTGDPLNEAADSLARIAYRGDLTIAEARTAGAAIAAARLRDIAATERAASVRTRGGGDP